MGSPTALIDPPARALLASVVDYAGLFPPASLSMADAVAAYARARRSPEAWLLGRFVVPAARLAELARAAQAQPAGAAWSLSVLVGDAPADDAGAIAAFEQRHGALARVDALELAATSPAEAEARLDALPPRRTRYVEIPPAGEMTALLAALNGRGARAKIRTGGVVPAAIPSAAAVARFITSCASAGVPFKATAGLHHPLRGAHPLSYEKDAPRGVMHGFLNVLAAAALASGGAAVDLEAVLLEEDPAAFRLDEDGLSWRQVRVDRDRLTQSRALAVSFGSCSFDEPVAGLRALGLL